MPYAWAGKCYPDTATALEAFKLDIPAANPSGINAFTAAPTITASGLINWSISNRPLTGTAATTRTGTTQLQTCTFAADNKFDHVAVQDIGVAVGVGLAFLLGIATGWNR